MQLGVRVELLCVPLLHVRAHEGERPVLRGLACSTVCSLLEQQLQLRKSEMGGVEQQARQGDATLKQLIADEKKQRKELANHAALYRQANDGLKELEQTDADEALADLESARADVEQEQEKAERATADEEGYHQDHARYQAEYAPRKAKFDAAGVHPSDLETLADLAKIADLSVFHFARVFKRATGSSPYHYVRERRLDLSRQLLADGQLPICELALACGFSNQSHFTSAFSRAMGMSPGRYRLLIRQ